jgi:hypothetical protein
VTPGNSAPSELPCGTTLYRAITNKGWFDRNDSAAILADAFFRRRPKEIDGALDPRDSDGLSLAIAEATSPDRFVAGFRRCFGVASLHLGRLRDLGLDVVIDPDDNTKVLVKNLPFERPGDAAAERLAGDVAKQARVVTKCDHKRE